MRKNLVQMLPLAVELLHLPEESRATIHLDMLRSLFGWVTAPFAGSCWLTSKEHSAPSGREWVAPHRQANSKAGEGITFKFFYNLHESINWNGAFCIYIYIYRVRHIKCYRAIALKLLIISKNVSDKSFSVREGRNTGPPHFFYRRRRWSYVKVNSTILNGIMFFFRWHYYRF